MDWIVTGSSHSGRDWLRRLVELYPDAVTMATNGSIAWHDDDAIPLDYLFVFDMVACEKFNAIAYRMKTTGTRLVTLERHRDALTARGVDRFDEFIGPARFKCNPGWFKRGEWNDMGLSGLWSVQYAINSGATAIHLPGHEGYRGTATDYESGMAHPNAAMKTLGVIQPGFQAMIDACPDVQFVFYGDLAYDVRGSNVTHCKKQAAESAAA